MQQVHQDGSTIVLRFARGEEVIGALRDFCQQRGIAAAEFRAIGACSAVTLSFYDLAAQTYRDQMITEELEICGLLGNVSRLDQAVVIHAHGTFSDRQGNVRGGHVKRVVVAATCELFLTVVDGELRRVPDPEVGLPLLR